VRSIADLAPLDDQGRLRVVVESPRGSAVKLKYCAALGVMQWHRPLPLGLRFPCEWGFVPGTLAADGDPVDALILAEVPTFPGIVVPCRALGLIEVEQDGPRARVRNDRIVAVPATAPRAAVLHTCDDLPERVRDEIVAFLLAAVEFEHRHVVVIGYRDPPAAIDLVERSRASTGDRPAALEAG
jgi:inorganic pyrophosphatase